jgi:hypothetical protein
MHGRFQVSRLLRDGVFDVGQSPVQAVDIIA